MMWRYIFPWLITLVLLISVPAADRYWVFFTDKGQYQEMRAEVQAQQVDFLLSPAARERRQIRLERGIDQFIVREDLPLDENYLEAVQMTGFRIHGQSRWLNAISGYGSPQVLEEIARFPFVDRTERVKSWKYLEPAVEESVGSGLSRLIGTPNQPYSYGNSSTQIQFHNIQLLHEMGLNGVGVRIAIFDTGFRLVNNALGHIRSQLLAEYDFIQQDSVTANQDGDASNQDSHGTEVLSVLAGFLPDTLIGPAFGARFLLAKTEIIDQELRLEEDNWSFAAEWAELMGADIVSSSVGYSTFDPGEGDYTYEDMDGQTTLVTRAANGLAARGVLVINSVGNEGNSSWRYLTAPADGEAVVAVGAVNVSNAVTSFSSIGPTFDGRIKPDVVALGARVYTATTTGNFHFTDGTSYSCPLIAGIAAQLLQNNPDLTLDEMMDILRTAGDNARNPDNFRGWGKVDAWRAWQLSEGIDIPTSPSVKAFPPYPNPYYRDGTVIFTVELVDDGIIHLEIYSVLGQQVYDLQYSGSAAGNIIPWNVRNQNGTRLAAGIYYYRITAGNQTFAGKLVVIY